MTYFFETYGCQMNSAESAALRLVLKERGWSQAPEGGTADLVVINTCSVRGTAEQRVLGRLAQYGALKKKRAFTLMIAGCAASRLGESLKTTVPGVDYVMGTSSRSQFPHIVEALEKGVPFIEDREPPAFSFSPVHHEAGQFRSFVPIMQGCNNFCSYCIVPYVRGPEKSRNPEAVLEEIRILADRGVREITLLGQNVNSYQWESGNTVLDFPGLLALTARAVENTPIRWVRFLSSHHKDLSPEVIRVMAEHPAFCRHLHLCVQHGSNAVLSAMNRRYTREQYLDLVAGIREAMPGISLTTDLLIGFPGETGEDLALTLDLMERVKFLDAYMYHYNPREGTRAFELPGRIEDPVKRERLAQVIRLQKQHTAALLRARIGERETVLVEGISRKNADELITRTERDERAVVPGEPSLIGRFGELTLSSLRGNTFHAKEISVCPGD